MQTILTIDDDDTMRSMTRIAFEKQDYQVIEAPDGLAGIEMARLHQPDLVLCDINMAKTDGYKVLETLRKDTRTSGIPFILMTGVAGIEEMRRGMNLGADDFLAKPFTIAALLSSVSTRLKKHAQIQAQATNTRNQLFAMLETTTDLVGLINETATRFSYLNQAGRKMLGLGIEEDLSHQDLDQLQPDPAWKLAIETGFAIARREGTWTGEMAFFTRADEAIIVSQMIQAHRGADGEIDYFSTNARNITESKRASLALESSRELYRIITENAGDLIALVDGKGKRLYNSPSYQTVLGYSPEDLRLTHGLEQVHPEDRPKIQEAAREAIKTGKGRAVQYRMRHRDGGWRILESTATTIQNASGDIDKIVIVARDITERKQMESELALQRDRLDLLMENIPDRIYFKDAQSRFMRCSKAFARQLGFDHAGEAVGKTDFDFFTPDYAVQAQTEEQKVLQTGQPMIARTEKETWRDGRTTWSLTTKMPLKDSDNRIIGTFGISTDITAIKHAEEQLLRSHSETENLLTSLSAILIGLDQTGHIRRWNTAAAATFGISSADSIGRRLEELPLDWDWPELCAGIADCRAKNLPVELPNVAFTNAQGKNKFLNLHLAPTNGLDDRQPQLILLGVDITQRHELETQLRQAQKLESIGQLAAGIAHEINTPTQFIGDNLRFLQEGFADLQATIQSLPAPAAASQNSELEYLLGEIPKAIAQSLDGVSRVAEIVGAMKDFSHPDQGEMKLTPLNKAIESTVTVARNEWKYVAEIVTDFDTSLPLVPCFPGDFNQVILNLVVNAAHAIAETPAVKQGGKGTITIRTRLAGDVAEISVQDTGTGVPEKIRGKIFDPFFTTKEVGKGTGQGLFIAHGVVTEKHGGTLHLETAMGVGSTFTIRLPLISPKAKGLPA